VKVSIEEIKKDEAKQETKQEAKQTYPCLKEHSSGDVVFFIGPEIGIVIKNDKKESAPSNMSFLSAMLGGKTKAPVGYFSNNLDERNFAILTKPIRISKDDLDASENYPTLKISKNTKTIVLFISKDIGICLSKGEARSSVDGEVSNGWNEDSFEPFKETLELSND
jgi:hypothetical protein